MKISGFDHLVINVHDVDAVLPFYRGILGLEVERLDEFRQGKAQFPSVRVSSEVLVDLVSYPKEKQVPNVDHFCLIIEPTDMVELASQLKAKGVVVEGDVRKRWGAHGWGLSFYVKDPEGNRLELKCYGIPQDIR